MGTRATTVPAALALLALVAAPLPAQGDVWADVASLLERLEYDEAVERLAPVAADAERPARDRLRALELQAVARVGAGRDDEARAVFARLRGGDPGWALEDPAYSPKIRALFAAAAVPAEPGALLTLEADPAAARDVTVHARFDPGRVYADSTELRFRWSEEGPWSSAAGAREPAGAWFRVPRPGGVPGTMRLRAVALVRAPSGEILARAGTDEAPTVVEVQAAEAGPPAEPRRRGSLFGQWWFWTAAGVLVAGGVAVAIVAGGGEDLPSPTLGSQTMR
jgi:hypothetical protein